MVYARKRKSYGRKGKRTMRKRMSRKSSALTVAKKALSLARKTMMSSTETKYYGLNIDTDVAGSSSFLTSAFAYNLSDPNNYTQNLFGSDGVTGNKAYLKYIRGNWEYHMDNLNNEEETVNVTVVIWRPRSDFDQQFAVAGGSRIVAVANGIPYFDPRKVQVLYYKHTTRTMGGTSPGTAGESIATGKFFIPVNRLIRFINQGSTGEMLSAPSSFQDQIWLTVYTDNSAIDTESPRMNAFVMSCWRDTDTNH